MEELLKEIIIIKWGVVCIAVSLWGMTVCFLLQGIPKWWYTLNKNRRLKQMKKDLEEAERPRTMKEFKSKWD